MPHNFIPFAHSLADASGAIIRNYFRTSCQHDTKNDASPVTIADRAAEAAIRKLIEQHYPEHGIVGEEYGISNEHAEYRWIIDPIDGTKSFMIGRAIFGTLISLTCQDIPILGIIDQPITGERWIGGINTPTTLNGKPVTARQCSNLASAVLCTTARELFNEADGNAYDRVKAQVKYANYGGDCYNYALLASGWVDIVLESGLKPHDFCALAPVIIAAGGMCTDWQGKPVTYLSDGRIVACGDEKVHEEVLGLL
jgi:inositol-phosphate phosphatase / L-galactose 1-phosphate phosphatase / histidinol-phosphatase